MRSSCHLPAVRVQAQRREAWDVLRGQHDNGTGWKPVLRDGGEADVDEVQQRSRRLATCGAARHRLQTCATGAELSEGLPVPREPALMAERSHDGEARAASSERRAGCPK